MSAEVLRRAAALMRETAEAATGNVWHLEPDEGGVTDVMAGSGFMPVTVATADDKDAAHIASWHPAVAIAVADWLDRQAEMSEDMPGFDIEGMGDASGLAVARAYLGESS